jgi:hypothetical protein
MPGTSTVSLGAGVWIKRMPGTSTVSLGAGVWIKRMPGTRIELVQPQGPRDFKSLASTYSATRAS